MANFSTSKQESPYFRHYGLKWLCGLCHSSHCALLPAVHVAVCSSRLRCGESAPHIRLSRGDTRAKQSALVMHPHSQCIQAKEHTVQDARFMDDGLTYANRLVDKPNLIWQRERPLFVHAV
eukprot:6470498-Amphidinium_carterae.1